MTPTLKGPDPAATEDYHDRGTTPHPDGGDAKGSLRPRVPPNNQKTP